MWLSKTLKRSELNCSQEGQAGTNKSTWKIAAEQKIHRSSVQQIAKHHLRLTAFCRVPTQIISDCWEEAWGGWESPSGSNSQLRHTSWFRLASDSVVKDDLTSYQKRPSWKQKLCIDTLLPKLVAIADCKICTSWLRFPTERRCTCTQCMCGTELDRHQLHQIHRQV